MYILTLTGKKEQKMKKFEQNKNYSETLMQIIVQLCVQWLKFPFFLDFTTSTTAQQQGEK